VPKTPRKPPNISARKAPRQARSNRLVGDILEAAVRVLARDGAARFTTARVAERAGVSVGSLYQYFPNKEAILFRLQTDEWAQTSTLLESILADSARPPMQRLRDMVVTFFQSEWDEAPLRLALGDAAPAYRDAPEARRQRQKSRRRALELFAELLPQLSPARRRLVGDLVMTTIRTMGAKVSGEARSKAEVEEWGRALADMLCAYLRQLAADAH
jgi:AcrR family transcriptional regulator